jgi:hypothetical protein
MVETGLRQDIVVPGVISAKEWTNIYNAVNQAGVSTSSPIQQPDTDQYVRSTVAAANALPKVKKLDSGLIDLIDERIKQVAFGLLDPFEANAEFLSLYQEYTGIKISPLLSGYYGPEATTAMRIILDRVSFQTIDFSIKVTNSAKSTEFVFLTDGKGGEWFKGLLENKSKDFNLVSLPEDMPEELKGFLTKKLQQETFKVADLMKAMSEFAYEKNDLRLTQIINKTPITQLLNAMEQNLLATMPRQIEVAEKRNQNRWDRLLKAASIEEGNR